MKYNLFNSIGFKVSIIYIALAIMNIVFFTAIIFENQIDIITDNSKLHAEKKVTSIISSIKKFSSEFETNIIKIDNKKKFIRQIYPLIRPIVKDFIFYSEKGNIHLKSNPDITLPSSYLQDTMKAMANQDFTGKNYYLRIDEESYKMFFYIPLQEYYLSSTLLFISIDIKQIEDHLSTLYRQAVIVFIITTLFHILFAILLFRVIIKPIQLLHYGSAKISSGDLSTRGLIKRQDEIGSLAQAFNRMADSIQGKMGMLEKQMKIITKTKNQIEILAITDELTGLYNRRYLFNRIEEEIKRALRREYSLSFIMIDIDNFKNFNDTYGHQVGDVVLKEVSNIVKNCCREMDLVARYGGEEIAVILPECPLENLFEIAERIRVSIENNNVHTTDSELSITVSVGGTCFNIDLLRTIGDSDTIIYFADVALYRAKNNGRNRVEIG